MRIAYGHGYLPYPGPPPDYTLRPAAPPPARDWGCHCRAVLDAPTGAARLRDQVGTGSRVAVIVNDNTRWANTPAFLPILLGKLLAAGVRDRDLVVTFATGAHRPLSRGEQEALVGAEARALTLVNHDCRAQDLVYLGTTRRGTPVHLNRAVAAADLRVLTGSIVPHFFAGFGGGRKALVPGVAGYATITANHRLMLLPGAETGRLRGNPVHEDLVEAAGLCGPSFLFNVVLDGERLLGAFAGDLVAAHVEGCRLAARLAWAHLERPADLVVASAGGLPYDLNFYQAQKALDNAARAARPGGAVLLVAACGEGWGSEAFVRYMRSYPDRASVERALTEEFVLGGHKAYAVRRVLEHCRVYLCSDLPAAEVRALGMLPVTSVEEVVAAESPAVTCLIPLASKTVPEVGAYSSSSTSTR